MAVGFQNVTSDAAINGAGVAVVIYAIHIISGGAGGVVLLKSGSTTGGTTIIKATGSANTGLTVTFGDGVTFGSGCFVDIDANTNSVMVSYEKV